MNADLSSDRWTGELADYALLVPQAPIEKLTAYYEGKTRSILSKYGPGPRVHYHTGLMDEPARPDAQAEQQRSQLVASQERMLRYACRAWRLSAVPFADVLDVGCGLGGGAIFWAQEFGARVIGVTIAPSHVALIRSFTQRAGVDRLVQPTLCDALAVPGANCFDAAMAIDSSSSFERGPWFHRLYKLLRPGGRVFIFDCFLGRPEYEEPFNRHWCARIGSIGEYLAAARVAGFRLETIEHVSHLARHFWTTTLSYMEAEAREAALSPQEAAKLEESLMIHAMVRNGLAEGGLTHALLSFVKEPRPVRGRASDAYGSGLA
jgi:cyclopropane fatty-acyl-phospholipid synthase-like methyltransferase